MANSPSIPDVIQTGSTTEFKAPNGFTPFSGDRLKEAQQTVSKFPEDGTATMKEPPKFEEPNPADHEMDKIMADILAQRQQKKPEEVVKQVEKNIPAEAKKSQSPWAKIWESIKKLFSPWNWSKKDVNRFANDFERHLNRK